MRRRHTANVRILCRLFRVFLPSEWQPFHLAVIVLRIVQCHRTPSLGTEHPARCFPLSRGRYLHSLLKASRAATL